MQGDKFETWMESNLKAKGVEYSATFVDFAAKGMDLNIVLCDASRGQVFIANAKTAKNARVVDAARISMSIPLAFRPATSETGGVKTYWVDGGTVYNYPVDLFGREADYDPHSTMGLVLRVEAGSDQQSGGLHGRGIGLIDECTDGPSARGDRRQANGVCRPWR